MWDELGISPSDDPKVIRRAYAARLKKLDPDRDPTAFARLREALEWALSEVEGAAQAFPLSCPHLSDGGPCPPSPSDPAPLDEAPAVVDVRDAASEWLEATASDRTLHKGFESALATRDTVAALSYYYRALATGAISIHAAPALLETLFAQAVEPGAVGSAALRELAHITGWDESVAGTDGTLSVVRRCVLARLAAEDWYDALLASAERRDGSKRKKARLARLMLGWTGKHLMPRVDLNAFKILLDEFRSHERWLSDRISPAWILKLESRWRRRSIAWAIFLTVFVAALLFDGVAVFTVEAINQGLSAGAILFAPFALAFLLWLLTLMTQELLSLVRQRPRPIGPDSPRADRD